MDDFGRNTKPLDLEDTYRQAVEAEVRAIQEIDPAEGDHTRRHGVWTRAIKATERAAELRRQLDLFRTEQGLH